MRNVAANAQALLDLDKDGALVPHGIGGHARTIITDLISEHGRLTARIAELEKALRDIAEAKMPGQARYIARTTLEASGGE